MAIKSDVVCDSVSQCGIRLTTMELNYPRFIHEQFMTHRMFSRNASSSRAIPIEKMIKQVEENPAMPIHWGKNQPGMQAREEIEESVRRNAKDEWQEASKGAADHAFWLATWGVHKQASNRLLEPFQWIKVIVTATEWDNFFKLRLHPDAQPEIYELARCMKEAMDESTPQKLESGEWHLPYYTGTFTKSSFGEHFEKALKCSIASNARVSYNNHDNSSPDIEKDIALADRLLAAGHMSPFEHIATPIREDSFNVHAEEGITHEDKHGDLWSGNFRGWIQYRQLLKD